MKPSPLISQRFQELAAKAELIAEAKTYAFTSEQGIRYYQVDTAEVKGWATNVLSLLQRVFGNDSVHYQRFENNENQAHEYYNAFRGIMSIFNAAREDYEGGYLFNLQSLVRAEVFDDVLEQAQELLSAGYKDPACVIAGVALETTIKELCSRNNIGHARLDRMNADLAKAGQYSRGMQKQITAWADRRNAAAHGEWETYADADVADMIAGVTRLIAEHL